MASLTGRWLRSQPPSMLIAKADVTADGTRASFYCFYGNIKAFLSQSGLANF